tara:strand:+ start:772 stop:1017 length:246 start_codon:yes stop_codon:yes gene_type:complete
MSPLSLPIKYYNTEKKSIHKVGYTMALGMMGIGLIETIHSLPYTLKGESNLTGMVLGPLGLISGGYMAYLYLNEAGVVGGY